MLWQSGVAHLLHLHFGSCRHKGVLQVWVLEAKDLHKQDIGGKADPFVQLQTRVQDLEKTVCPDESRVNLLLHNLTSWKLDSPCYQCCTASSKLVLGYISTDSRCFIQGWMDRSKGTCHL